MIYGKSSAFRHSYYDHVKDHGKLVRRKEVDDTLISLPHSHLVFFFIHNHLMTLSLNYPSELYEMQTYLQTTRSRWLALLENHVHISESTKPLLSFSCRNEQRMLEHPHANLLSTFPSSNVWIDDGNTPSTTYPVNESHEQSFA
jgi:hypothetical protein